MLLALDFTNPITWLWLLISVVCIVIEIFTLDLVCIWFSLGALLAFILNIFNVPLPVQVSVFIIVSLALVFTIGRYAKMKLIHKNSTNVDLLIGKEVYLLKETSRYVKGEIKINDVIWSTTTDSLETIEKGELVVIKKIEGNKVYITKK